MRKKYEIGICGSFGATEKTFDGQTIKIQNLAYTLKKILGEDKIATVNTHFWRKQPFKTLISSIMLGIRCKKLIILPDSNGIKVILPLYICLKKLFRADVFYSVVGGWLPELLKKNRFLYKLCTKTDKLLVETKTMQAQLEEIGITNVCVIANFKNIRILPPEELEISSDIPYRLCTFSRVVEQKGIKEAVDVVKQINESFGKTVYTLDIYGHIDSSFSEEFASMREAFPEYINFCGAVDSSQTNDVLKKYFMLLFPTKFRTEGLPGTIIDAFCAGVPVLSARWNSCSDIVDDGVNGLTFGFCDFEDMKEKLIFALENPEIINGMKRSCTLSAERYLPEKVAEQMMKEMNQVEY